MIKRLVETTALLLLSITAFGQLPSTGVSANSGVLDGVYVQEHIPTKRVIQYTHLREADVMWSKRVWRYLDLREKQNQTLYYPEEPISDRMSLFDVIKYGIFTEGSITVYGTGFGREIDDMFRYPYVKKPNESDGEFKARIMTECFGCKKQIAMIDPVTFLPMTDQYGNPVYKDTITEYLSNEVIAYKVKEDWFFDKQRSVMDVRIIGIAPVFQSECDGLQFTSELFWLYFPECRYVFQNFFVYNPHNDAQRMSFDDLFWKRDFNSYIYKESNVYDRKISPSWVGVEALLESERIKGEMFRMEHDLWNL
ncbi:MAG: gliding motility protein GldN [Flavobacteriales bacterium]|nr:gliding motility protein GldN [Flavobacteriales bacterium]